MYTLKNIIAVVLLGIASLGMAQTPEAATVTPIKPYDSSVAKLAVQTIKSDYLQSQSLDLTKAIAAAIEQFNQSQKAISADFQNQQKILSDWQDSIRKANGWDSSYTWNATTDTWEHPKPTKPADAPPAKK